MPKPMSRSALAALLAVGVSAAPLAIASAQQGCSAPTALCEAAGEGGFPLIADGQPAPVYAAEDEHDGVLRALRNLADDLGEIGGAPASLTLGELPREGLPVLVGSLDRSDLIRKLVDEGKLDTAGIAGQWEAYVQAVVENPLPGVERALVIAGADERGTIYGVYDLLDRAGMSPWHWWADVPAKRHEALHVAPGRRVDAPKVKYRGIFLNDENPALFGFANDTFGGFNADFYEHVYDLILRLQGNYLWPAMWGKALYDDDPRNAQLADEMGIVLGTSHHEPMMRAHIEWDRYGEGDWNYDTNAKTLRAFWREGIERMGDGETLVTVGMRGDGDEAMTEGTAIDLLERIVADQRGIIEDVTGEPAEEQPQVWALYKEVQDYYDQGMEVPDDVTLLFADDNWGNLRRLPEPGAERPGGYGVYYHFDYVGGPRNYKWINTTQIERAWEQMNTAYEYGADRLWIVNVGDLKPMEFPIDFFLEQAWDPEAMTLERVDGYARDWAAEQFGETHAEEIGSLLETYTKYNSRRKPELLDADTYDAASGEWDRVADAYQELAERADALREDLAPRYDDAFVQLVWFPIQASANLHDLYRAVALNRLYAKQGRPQANAMADAAEAAFARDAELTRLFHEEVAGGKWNHMMSQTHIGYTYWQQPDEQAMPEVTRLDVPRAASLGVAAQQGAEAALALPPMDVFSQQAREIEIFSRGQKPVRFHAEAGAPWLTVSPRKGKALARTLTVTADWDAVPVGEHEVPITVSGPGGEAATVMTRVMKPENAQDAAGFVLIGGEVAMEATSAACRMDGDALTWREIPNLGRTGSALTVTPPTADAAEPGAGPRLDYLVTAFQGGEVTVEATLSPSLDVRGQDGLAYAVSLGDEAPQIARFDLEPDDPAWNEAVSDNAVRVTTTHDIDPGRQVLRLYAMDPNVVFQRIAVRRGDASPLYLGAKEGPLAGNPSCEDTRMRGEKLAEGR
ncbi:glycosyl hydrolase 115 family protein [Parvularcula oceani]|uniref:glycosyl hydrolase 115 family protein n=1 Tax=Parvularcula oceani TaxID=1247963 RepID=UPI000AAF2B2B|nr:glycosyl hydrolase 115 family protein [Parvularcula oceani]